MSTLTTKYGIEWLVSNILGKTAYFYNGLAVAWCNHDNHYHLIQCGKSILRSKGPGECLEKSSEAILEAYANQFQPTWA